MRPLTDSTPKPLLKANGKALIEYHIEKLVDADIKHIVINTGWLGKQLPEALGSGTRYGCQICYSPEAVGALETAGGIQKALPMLDPKQTKTPFFLVNGDVYCELNFKQFIQQAQVKFNKDNQLLADLALVNNPAHHPKGDFALADNDYLALSDTDKLTYSGIGLYHPTLFKQPLHTPAKLGPVLKQAINDKCITGYHMQQRWFDIGTPQRLTQLEQQLNKQ